MRLVLNLQFLFTMLNMSFFLISVSPVRTQIYRSDMSQVYNCGIFSHFLLFCSYVQLISLDLLQLKGGLLQEWLDVR